MARVNFGRTPTVRGYNPLANTLKPGHVIQLEENSTSLTLSEGLTFDIVCTANGNTSGTNTPQATIADISKMRTLNRTETTCTVLFLRFLDNPSSFPAPAATMVSDSER